MTPLRAALLILCGLLAGCGGSQSTTLSVTCGGSLNLAGATSIDVVTDATAAGAVLSFPDPANQGHTETLAIKPGARCTIAPTGRV